MRNRVVRPVRAGCYSWAALSLIDSKTLYCKNTVIFIDLLFGSPLQFSNRGRIKDRRMTRMNLLFVPSFSPSRLLSCSDHASAIQESGGLKKEEIPNFNCRAHANQYCRILWGHFIFILHSRTILNYAIASYRDSQQDLLIASFFHVGSLSIQYSIRERSTSKMLQFLIDKTMNCTIQF